MVAGVRECVLHLEQIINMKKILSILLLSIIFQYTSAQDNKEKITRACLNYLEGFYEGDSAKLIQSVKPSLYKTGFWKDKQSGKYNPDGNMTYRQAIEYANKVLEKKGFAKADAPKKVEVLDISNSIAAAKVTAWWGLDYILLSKQEDKWMIEEVLWEGPLEKKD